jgi:D-sedoheptulose 7-phosphate isomerase
VPGTVPIADTAAFLDASIACLRAFAADEAETEIIARMADGIAGAMRDGGKLLIAGNGGSAGDAQHIAGEFVVRLLDDRDPLPAIALTTDSSVLTAAGNDYGYDQVFARQVRALGRSGDVLLVISTSGNSPNILAALEAARAAKLLAYGFGGESGGRMAHLCDLLLRVPSPMTAIVQQVHITAAHILCAKVEAVLQG